MLHPIDHHYSQVNVREKNSLVAERFRRAPSCYDIVGCKPCLRRANEALTWPKQWYTSVWKFYKASYYRLLLRGYHPPCLQHNKSIQRRKNNAVFSVVSLNPCLRKKFNWPGDLLNRLLFCMSRQKRSLPILATDLFALANPLPQKPYFSGPTQPHATLFNKLILKKDQRRLIVRGEKKQWAWDTAPDGFAFFSFCFAYHFYLTA